VVEAGVGVVEMGAFGPLTDCFPGEAAPALGGPKSGLSLRHTHLSLRVTLLSLRQSHLSLRHTHLSLGVVP
jgi:hypothetical protein